MVAGLSCPSPYRAALTLRCQCGSFTAGVQSRSGSLEEQLRQPHPPCSLRCSSPGAQAAVGLCSSSFRFFPCGPGAAAASPGIQPREATPCWAVVSAGQGQAAAPAEVRHSVCCLIISCPRARSQAHTNTARLR